MKAPSLLLLAVVAASAAPAFADGPAHRCDVGWLNKAAATQLGVPVEDSNKYLTAAAGQAPTIDITNPSKLCDATVWHYLAVLEPVGEPILDPRTRQPIGGVRLRWNDPALQQEWAKGLSAQIKILLDADARYQRVDSLGRDALTKAEAVVAAAEKAGIAKRADVAGPAALKKLGYTGDAYVEDKGYTVAAIPADAASAPQDPAALQAAFLQVLDDDNPAAAPKPKAVKRKTAPAAPAAPPAAVKYKAGAAVAAFRKAVVALANEARSARPDAPKTAFADADYEGAVKFVTDPAIAKGDESGAYPAAALSALDYGLRNLIALRVAAVAKSVDAAKERVKGQSVAAALAAAKLDKRLPVNQSSADMAAAVLRHLDGVKDYHDLNALYDRESAKPDSDWMKANGADVKAQLEGYRADAKATSVVIDKDTKGRALQYSIGQQKVTDSGIAVADLDKSQGYRETIAEAIAQNIATAPINAKAQAALAAFRGEGAPGATVAPALTKPQEVAVGELPVKPVIAVTAPPSPYDALLKASPAQGFLGSIFNPKGAVERYYSKFNEAASEEAQTRASHRTDAESAAETAAEAVQARLEAQRSQLAAAPSDPDDAPAVAAAKREAALKAFDLKAAADIKAAHDGVIASDQGYVPADKAAAELKAKRDALNATVDAAYTDGIDRAVDALDVSYKTVGSRERKYAEAKSGYSGAFYKTDRVDAYFTQNWKGANQAAAVAKCKAALGFNANGSGGNFKDPSPENVDKRCGVRDGLVMLLASYRGSNKALPAAPAK